MYYEYKMIPHTFFSYDASIEEEREYDNLWGYEPNEVINSSVILNHGNGILKGTETRNVIPVVWLRQSMTL